MVLGPVHKQRWIYAASKSLLERILYAHGMARSLEHTIVRPFNFIGSRIDYLVPAGSMGGPRVFAHFMSALLQEGRCSWSTEATPIGPSCTFAMPARRSKR